MGRIKKGRILVLRSVKTLEEDLLIPWVRVCGIMSTLGDGLDLLL